MGFGGLYSLRNALFRSTFLAQALAGESRTVTLDLDLATGRKINGAELNSSVLVWLGR